MPVVLLRAMEEVELAEKCRVEVAAMWRDFVHGGSCGFNQRRFQWWADGRVRSELVDFCRMLEKRGLMKQTRQASIGNTCIRREFDGELARYSKKPMISLCNSSTSEAFSPLSLSPVLLEERDECWEEWCLLNGHTLRLDSDGKTAWGRAIHKGILAISLPEEVDETGLDEKKKTWLRAYLEHKKEGLSPYVALKRGRLYHALINCPSRVRRQAQYLFNGVWEASATADIHACYVCILVSKMEPSAEKDELIELLKTRAFHSTLASALGREVDKKWKADFQKQCLFYPEHWPEEKRSLMTEMRSRWPKLVELICEARAEMCVGGFSDWLMRHEAKIVVHGALVDLAEECPCLSIHDALLVPASMGIRAAELIQEHAIRVLGFAPNVKVE